MSNDLKNADRKRSPYAMVGAGDLVSRIDKSGDDRGGWRYRFNVFRLKRNGKVDQRFSPHDIKPLVKLVRVLAATLAQDGCLSSQLRRELFDLAEGLDELVGPERVDEGYG